MGNKRTIILDEDELIMIIGKDVVGQIDECRGEMNRTEFVNLLIQSQLRRFHGEQDYVTKKEFNEFALETKEILHNFLEITLSCALAQDDATCGDTFEELKKHEDYLVLHESISRLPLKYQ